MTLGDLEAPAQDEVDLLALKDAGLVRRDGQDRQGHQDRRAEAQGELKGIGATAGAKTAIEAAGGSVEVVPAAE